jgi:hypothetical protein
MINGSVIYKYVSIGTAKSIINNNCLRVTPPNEFNDPFELLGEKITGFDLSKAEAAVKELPIHDIIKSLNIPEEYKDKLKQNSDLKKLSKIIHGNITDESSALEYLKYTVDQISEKIGIVCLTEKNDNILMWSHYAEQHRGLVIGFDSNKLSDKIFRVNYGKKRAEIKYGELNAIENVLPLLLRKSIDWQYEDECRYLYELNSCTKIDSKDFKCGFLYLQPLQEFAIVEVVFGCRISEEDKKELSRIIASKNSNGNILVRQAAIHNTDFSITIT